MTELTMLISRVQPFSPRITEQQGRQKEICCISLIFWFGGLAVAVRQIVIMTIVQVVARPLPAVNIY